MELADLFSERFKQSHLFLPGSGGEVIICHHVDEAAKVCIRIEEIHIYERSF